MSSGPALSIQGFSEMIRDSDLPVDEVKSYAGEINRTPRGSTDDQRHARPDRLIRPVGLRIEPVDVTRCFMQRLRSACVERAP